MRIVGDRMESASVVPNRTACAMRDVACLLRTVQDEGLSGETLLDRLAVEFRRLCFSDVIMPISSVLDQDEEEVVSIYVSSALLTFMDSGAEAPLYVAFLVIKTFESRTREVCRVPLLVCEIETLTALLSAQQDLLTRRIGKFLVSRVRPVARRIPLYLDHSGFDNSRDNSRESSAKQLALGEATDRTVRVEPFGDSDVALVDTVDNEAIFELRRQTNHSTEFRRAVAEIFRELENIIPPPVKTEHEPDVLAMLPSRQVKALLKSGQSSL